MAIKEQAKRLLSDCVFVIHDVVGESPLRHGEQRKDKSLKLQGCKIYEICAQSKSMPT